MSREIMKSQLAVLKGRIESIADGETFSQRQKQMIRNVENLARLLKNLIDAPADENTETP